MEDSGFLVLILVFGFIGIVTMIDKFFWYLKNPGGVVSYRSENGNKIDMHTDYYHWHFGKGMPYYQIGLDLKDPQTKENFINAINDACEFTEKHKDQIFRKKST